MRVAHGALAVLEVSLGNYEPALRHGLAAFEDEPVTTRDSEVDLVEAAVRCGDPGGRGRGTAGILAPCAGQRDRVRPR